MRRPCRECGEAECGELRLPVLQVERHGRSGGACCSAWHAVRAMACRVIIVK